MQLNISGHNSSVKAAVKELIEAQLKKLSLRFASLNIVNVITGKKHNEYSVEISATFEELDISVTGKGESTQKALRKANERFIRALDSRKGVLISKRQSSHAVNEDSIAHEKIQEMKLA